MQKNSSVLISGGSGLVGKHLTSLLLSKGYNVSHLSRKTNQFGLVRVYKWDHVNKFIDPAAFEGIDFIIHLAGANIGEKRWSNRRKEEIVKSRVESARFLHKVITGNGIRLKAFISASAVGYYGSITSGKIFQEEDPSGEDFLGNTCRQWEDAADLFENSGIRTVKIRTAVVLEKSDSALSKLMKPAEYGFLVRTGNGRQYMPWIHIKDLCNIYLQAIREPGMTGAYNAVSPEHATHREFVKILGQKMNRPVLFFSVPASLLKVFLGEMSEVILNGSRISSGKIENAGYRFLFNNLEDALENIISPVSK